MNNSYDVVQQISLIKTVKSYGSEPSSCDELSIPRHSYSAMHKNKNNQTCLLWVSGNLTVNIFASLGNNYYYNSCQHSPIYNYQSELLGHSRYPANICRVARMAE